VKVRILVASGQWFPDRKSGFARVVTDTARGLAARGHTVTAVVPEHGHEPTIETDGSLTIRRAIGRNALPRTVTDIVETARRGRRLEDGDFDVILAHSASSALGVAAAGLDAPLAVVFHASVPREARFDRERLPVGAAKLAGYAMAPLLSTLEKRSLRRADCVLALSEYSRTLLLEDGAADPGAIHVVRGGVDAEHFRPVADRRSVRERLGLPEERPVLLTVRRLEPRMGIENLLAAFASLRRARDVVLVVAGTGSLATVLRRTTVRLGIDEHVRFLAEVSDTSLLEWYNAADLFVLPTIAYEGFGMATAESLASGTPVVGTPVGATPELLDSLEPRLVAAGTAPDDLAAALDTALDLANDELRERCRAYALERLAWQHVLPLWEQALTDLAAANGR
jgi:glycosyltransferase involved in cell wall biosynthesis